MKPSRREFVQISAAASAGLLLWREKVYGLFNQSPTLQKFIQPMRRFGIEIPIASKVSPGDQTFPCDYYEMAMREFTDQLHPNLPPTALRGYGNLADGAAGHKHLSGAIVASKGTPVRVRWTNELDAGSPYSLGLTGIPVDLSVVDPYKFGQTLGHDRAAVHLHGGLVPWPSDGGPFHWFNAGGTVKGPSVVNWLPGVVNGEQTMTDDYWYPNTQTARLMWYHDHAVGITRLNAYAGLATGYILLDAEEAALMGSLGIPPGLGIHPGTGPGTQVPPHLRQLPGVIQDKVFNTDGTLWYPNTYDLTFFALTPTALPLPDPSLVPEFWGDTMLANGTVYPYVEVEPRRYRIRLLNACNTRFLSLRLLGALGRRGVQTTEPDLANPGPAMTLIGTEGGFLDGSVAPKGVVYDNVAMPLVLAPAERADIIIDFSKVKTRTVQDAQCFILYNDAPVPFPGGTPLADFYPQNKKLAAPPAPGFGPNTRTLLQFRVLPLGSLTGDTKPDPPVDPAWALLPTPAPAQTVPGTRDLVLYETVDEFGRLAQNLGTLARPMAQLEPATEVVQAGSVEVWRVFNVSADTHPIHFHFFNVRVLSRQPFSWRGGAPNLSGQPMPPEPCEQGWKETVRFNPGECTTLLVELPPTGGLAPTGVTVPDSPRSTELGFTGAEYVWHCHILEHEEHDMMRPLVVQG
ncbi:MAG: multicopper oxidase family protein [Vicinamibacterales bacterium]